MSEATDWREALQRAADHVGGVTRLAFACGLNRNAMYFNIKLRRTPLPAEIAVKVVAATGGAVTLRELAPDVFEAVAREVEAGQKVAAS